MPFYGRPSWFLKMSELGRGGVLYIKKKKTAGEYILSGHGKLFKFYSTSVSSGVSSSSICLGPRLGLSGSFWSSGE